MAINDSAISNLRFNTVSQQLEFAINGQWFGIPVSGGIPGGTNGQVQYNNSGAFGANSAFTTDGSGDVNLTGNLHTGSTIVLSGSGILEYDGTAFIFERPVGVTLATTIDPSAALEVDSTTLGFLMPRMDTTTKEAIATPAEGLMVYDTTLHKLSVWTGAAWETVTSS